MTGFVKTQEKESEGEGDPERFRENEVRGRRALSDFVKNLKSPMRGRGVLTVKAIINNMKGRGVPSRGEGLVEGGRGLLETHVITPSGGLFPSKSLQREKILATAEIREKNKNWIFSQVMKFP